MQPHSSATGQKAGENEVSIKMNRCGRFAAAAPQVRQAPKVLAMIVASVEKAEEWMSSATTEWCGGVCCGVLCIKASADPVRHRNKPALARATSLESPLLGR
ncbi:MAG: hypothetical protein ACI83N_000699 [Hydrogenophaga sp.]